MFKLSLALSVPVYQLEQEMPSSIFSEYIEYHSLSPFGDDRANFHSATIAAVVANSNRGKNAKAFGVDDFMFKSSYDKEKEQVEAMMSFMKGFSK